MGGSGFGLDPGGGSRGASLGGRGIRAILCPLLNMVARRSPRRSARSPTEWPWAMSSIVVLASGSRNEEALSTSTGSKKEVAALDENFGTTST